MNILVRLGDYMVGVCIVSKEGRLLEIKEVPDNYRYIKYNWDDDK